MNKLILLGRLAKDVELRYTQTGVPVASFSIAVNDRYAKEEPKADFFNVIVWNKLAEFASKHLGKGLQICLEGRLKNRNYTNKDGIKIYVTEVVAENIYFADKKREQQQSEPEKDSPWQFSNEAYEYNPEMDSLPF